MKIAVYSYFGYSLSFVELLNMIGTGGFRITAIGLGMEEDLVRTGKADLMPGPGAGAGMEVEYVHVPEEICSELWPEA